MRVNLLRRWTDAWLPSTVASQRWRLGWSTWLMSLTNMPSSKSLTQSTFWTPFLSRLTARIKTEATCTVLCPWATSQQQKVHLCRIMIWQRGKVQNHLLPHPPPTAPLAKSGQWQMWKPWDRCQTMSAYWARLMLLPCANAPDISYFLSIYVSCVIHHRTQKHQTIWWLCTWPINNQMQTDFSKTIKPSQLKLCMLWFVHLMKCRI